MATDEETIDKSEGKEQEQGPGRLTRVQKSALRNTNWSRGGPWRWVYSPECPRCGSMMVKVDGKDKDKSKSTGKVSNVQKAALRKTNPWRWIP